MDAQISQLITLLHQSRYRCVLAVTGGGAGAIAWLLSVPGGSRTVLEASVAYSEDSLKEYLGRAPQFACSVATSQEMAVRAQIRRAAWRRAHQRPASVARPVFARIVPSAAITAFISPFTSVSARPHIHLL